MPKEKGGVSDGLTKKKCLFNPLTSPVREACAISSKSQVIKRVFQDDVLQFNYRICIKKKNTQVFSDMSFPGPDLFHARLLLSQL